MGHFSWLMSWYVETDLLTSHLVTLKSAVQVSSTGYNYKTKLLYKIRQLNLDVFHIAFLIRYFLIHDPSPHPMGWQSSMPLFLMFITYNKSLFFRVSMSSTYSFNIISLYDVLLKKV